MVVWIDAPKGYDLLLSVHSWVYPDVQPVPETTSRDVVRRVMRVDASDVAVTLGQARPGAKLSLVHSPCASTTHLRQRIRWVTGTEIDIEPALELLRSDSITSSFVDFISGIRPYSTDTVFEGLMKAVIQQQVSYRAANVLTARLVSLVGRHLKFGEDNHYGFPTAEDIASLQLRQLRAIGLGFKAAYLRNLSRLVMAGDLDLEQLVNVAYDEVAEILKPIRGIGEWTTQALAIASLHKFEVFPYSDIGIRNLMGRLYNKGIRLSGNEIRSKAESWGNFGGLALYLLMCADVLGLAGAGSRKRIKAKERS